MARLGPITDGAGRRHRIATERITIEPFDLRDRPRYALVIDRLAYWYYVPREWLKKVALMNDVYLLEQPVHLPVDGEARRLLRDDPPRAEGAADRDGAAQGPAGQLALPVHGGASTTSRSTWPRSPSRSATRCS